MEYLEYHKKHQDGVLKLLRESFDNKNISSKSFNWKHFDELFADKAIAMVAVEEGFVCSFVCFNPIEIISNKKVITFYSCSVQATDKNYRRRGIVSDLTQIIEKKLGNDINYFGFSNESGVQIDLHSKRINYKVLGQLKTYYLFCAPKFTKMKIKQISRLDNLFLTDTENGLCRFRNSDKYLDWRYARNPKNKFLYFQFFLNKEKVGYMILKKIYFKYEITTIVMANQSLYKKAIRALSSYSFTHGIFICSITFLPNNTTDQLFYHHVLTKKIPVYFTVKSKVEAFNSPENWFVQGGDIQ